MMIIKTPRSLSGLMMDGLLTAMAWAIFGYLLVVGVRSALSLPLADPATPFVSAFLPDIQTLLGYAIVSSCIGLLLYSWAGYNARRFSGVHRRRMRAPLTDQRLALSFGLNPARIAHLHSSRRALIHHAENGQIVQVVLDGALDRRGDDLIELADWRAIDTHGNSMLPHTTNIDLEEMNNDRLHGPARGLSPWRSLQ